MARARVGAQEDHVHESETQQRGVVASPASRTSSITRSSVRFAAAIAPWSARCRSTAVMSRSIQSRCRSKTWTASTVAPSKQGSGTTRCGDDLVVVLEVLDRGIWTRPEQVVTLLVRPLHDP